MHSLKSLFAIVATIGATIGSSQEATALDAGKQYTAEQIQKDLAAEQQHVVITSNKLIISADSAKGKTPSPSTDKLPLEGAFFTMNESGTRAIIFSPTICSTSRFLPGFSSYLSLFWGFGDWFAEQLKNGVPEQERDWERYWR